MHRTFARLLPIAMLVVGCAKQIEPMQSAPPLTSHESVTTLGTSVEGRPLELHTFNGSVPRPVLIFAAIHGDEGTTAYCTEKLIETLRATPSVLGGMPVAIVPVANPDGLAARTRVNARGVDLNRNFPASNFAAPPTGRPRNNPGLAPASEPETRVLIRLIETLNPRRICTIHSIGQGRQQNNYDGPAQALAELMSRHNHYPASPNIGYATPGSFGTWAGIDRRIPVITLELPNRTPGPQAWADNRGALLAFIRGE